MFYARNSTGNLTANSHATKSEGGKENIVELKEAIAKANAGELKFPNTCPLCLKASDGPGIFVPTDSFAAEIGQPLGKQRFVIYGSCVKCLDTLGLKEYMARIELVLRIDTLK
jgi:hypothetical protein